MSYGRKRQTVRSNGRDSEGDDEESGMERKGGRKRSVDGGRAEKLR